MGRFSREVVPGSSHPRRTLRAEGDLPGQGNLAGTSPLGLRVTDRAYFFEHGLWESWILLRDEGQVSLVPGCLWPALPEAEL